MPKTSRSGTGRTSKPAPRAGKDGQAKALPVTAPKPQPEPPRGAPGVRRGFDILVTDAPGIRSTFLAPAPAAKAAFRLARRPDRVARRLTGLATEVAATAAGASQRVPSPKDRRFADSAWQQSWLFRRIAQAYLAAVATAEDLISDAELGWADDEPAAVRSREHR